MNAPRLLPVLLALLALLAGAAHGQQNSGPTYRSVGPDGKITFSDRKPTDPQQHTRELGRVETAPLVTPSSQPFDLRPATTLPPHAAASEGTTPALDISGRPFPPGLPDAILDVMVHQYFVQTLIETCGKLHPAASERYQGGVRNWRDRSAEILDKSNRITFTRFTGEQRDILRATARARLTQLMAASDDADKAAWCDHMSGELALRHFELVGDLRVAPILYFQAP